MSNDKPSRRELGRMRNDALRTLAIDAGLQPEETWTKEDFVEALVAAGAANEDPDSGQTKAKLDQSGERKTNEQAPDKGQPMYDLLVSSTDGAGGNSPVDVSINGYLRRIPRDKWVRVPESVVEVLNNAVNTRLEQAGKDESGRPQYEERNARRFSFQAIPVRDGA